MKIHADKTDNGPRHAFTPREVRLILSSVPPDWIDGLKTVRLANGHEGYLPWASFFRPTSSLIIYSRRAIKDRTLAAILSALAAHSLNIQICVSRPRPSEADQRRLWQFIQPWFDTILAKLEPSRIEPTLRKLSPEAHTPMEFLPFPNDVA